ILEPRLHARETRPRACDRRLVPNVDCGAHRCPIGIAKDLRARIDRRLDHAGPGHVVATGVRRDVPGRPELLPPWMGVARCRRFNCVRSCALSKRTVPGPIVVPGLAPPDVVPYSCIARFHWDQVRQSAAASPCATRIWTWRDGRSSIAVGFYRRAQWWRTVLQRERLPRVWPRRSICVRDGRNREKLQP